LSDEIPFFISIVNLLILLFLTGFTWWYARSTKKLAEVAKAELDQLIKERRITAFIELTKLLEQDDIRKARGTLIKIGKSGKQFKDWSKEEKEEVEKVCYSYSVAGILVSEELIEKDLVIQGWHDSITKCREAADPMIIEYRRERGEDFWNGFENLYKMAKELTKKSES